MFETTNNQFGRSEQDYRMQRIRASAHPRRRDRRWPRVRRPAQPAEVVD